MQKAMKRSHSSSQWLRRHVSDPYVQRSKREGYRSRSAYKLAEIDARDRLLGPGMTVVDLGAAPGGWAQVAAKRVGPSGHVLAVDLLEMEPVPGVAFVRADFTTRRGLAQVERALGGRRADVVLSDMAPNLSGIAVSDQARSMELAEAARDFALRHLREGAPSWSRSSRERGTTATSGRCAPPSAGSPCASPRPPAAKAPSSTSSPGGRSRSRRSQNKIAGPPLEKAGGRPNFARVVLRPSP